MTTAAGRFPWRDRALIGLFTFAICVAWIVALPPWQGPDEPAHYAYIERLSHGAYPRHDGTTVRFSAALGTSVVRSIESFRTGQDRPLTADSERVLIRPEPDGLSTEGRTAITATTYPPLYYLLVLPFYEIGGDRATDRLYAVRVGSAVMASVFAVLTALLVFDATRKRRLALAAGMLAALPPMLGQTGALVSPDVLMCAATAWSILAIWRVRQERTRGRVAAVVIALAVVALSKPVGPAVAGALLTAFFGRELVRRVSRRRSHTIAGYAAIVAVLALAAWKQYAPALLSEHPLAGTRLALSYAWQFYLPKLPFMDPVFQDSVLTQPLPVWGTLVRTGVGYFGWISAPMPEWSYIAVVLGTAVAMSIPIVALRRRAFTAATTECLIFIVLLLLIFHAAEYSVYSSTRETILQGRYLLPAIPAALLVFMVPLAQSPRRTQTAAIGIALATWTLAAVVGLSSAVSFFT
jgi:4-amino-4-deoxy-L-arabinose transferase-like glycosyltransferase